MEKVEKGSTCDEKENIENKDSSEKVEHAKQSAPNKKPPAKVETKSFGKKDKEVEKKSEDDNKKRKRIQVLSDSEEEEEEERDLEEKVVEPPPPQAQLLNSDSEDEEVTYSWVFIGAQTSIIAFFSYFCVLGYTSNAQGEDGRGWKEEEKSEETSG